MNNIYVPKVVDETCIDLETFDMQKELALFEDYTPRPTDILIRLYIKPTVSTGGIIRVNTGDEIYSGVVGYVAKIGSRAFTGERYEDWGRWYKEGDWIVFPRAYGNRFVYAGLPVFSIVDDAPLGVIKDPRKVK